MLAEFQCSSASRKFSIRTSACPAARERCSFSALQRAENSQYHIRHRQLDERHRFSALQRAENSQSRCCDAQRTTRARRFSALQRAENSQLTFPLLPGCDRRAFQCSSASRKFSIARKSAHCVQRLSFSALQRAENSQCRPDDNDIRVVVIVSVLFSEPKILNRSAQDRRASRVAVSVLFSEPKILNVRQKLSVEQFRTVFQCSSASRKFSIVTPALKYRNSG